jgi:hypothetical protein
MFGFNLFTVGRFFETTTLLWLSAIVVLLVGAGGFLARSSSGTMMEKVGYALAGFGILLLIIFLIYGYYFVQQMPGTCLVCPGTPLRQMITGQGFILPVTMNLLPQNPYENTFIYYLSIPMSTPSKSTTQENQSHSPKDTIRIIRRQNHFGLSLDTINGNLYLDNGFQEDLAESPDSTLVGQMHFQTITQIAIIQNQKTFNVFINGKLTGVHTSKSLPYQPGQSTLINESGGIQLGILYHVELHKGRLTSEELRDHWEALRIQYMNDTRLKSQFSNTQLPGNTNLGIVGWINGIFRVFFGTLGYSDGTEVAINSVKKL